MSAVKTVKLKSLFNGDTSSLPDIEISSIEYDSRKLLPGSCFVAVKGYATDGHLFIGDAIKRGAALIVAEKGADISAKGVTVVRVKDTRKALAKLADRFYGHPSGSLGVIGVTGTNGKTTVTYMLQSLLNAAGFNTSRFGTVGYEFPDESVNAPNTTPESVDLQRMFNMAAGYENPRCVIEVSSHGLEQGRLECTDFRGGVFTNLTQDHLDFHGDMDSYAKAKRKLFTEFDLEYSIINCDDPVGREWLGSGLKGQIISYGASGDADVRLVEASTGLGSGILKVATPVGNMIISLRLPGMHNIMNSLATISVGVAEGLPEDIIANGLSAIKSVPGRFEVIDEGQDFAVVVDYAHTDNALANLLKTARPLAKGRLICLFGCGGDRDRGKRPLMGRVAAEMADVVVVTSDNPRTEDPQKIINEILAGIPPQKIAKVTTIVSRKEAIEYAMRFAKAGDMVLVAGKGHEDYQIIGTKKLNFDDRKVAAAILRGMK